MDSKVLIKTYLESKVVMKGDYPYFINPISDGNPAMTKDLLDEVTDDIISISDLDCDLILAPEAMAIPYAAVMTVKTGIPFQIIRKRGHGLSNEIAFEKSTGYESSQMFLHDIPRGTKAVLVDDVISTGGTLKSIVKNLRDNGIIITEIIAILNKSDDIDALSADIGIPIRSLIRVSVIDGKPVVL